VTIPASVAEIGQGAFDCTNLASAFFRGNAPLLYPPGLIPVVFSANSQATAYYLPGTSGWESTFFSIPTALWSLPYPLILNGSLGVLSNQFGFTISWATNTLVVVEASADLNNPKWSPVQTNALNNGVVYFIDAEWANYPSRFYRVRSQ
jgi:hypothetical protein